MYLDFRFHAIILVVKQTSRQVPGGHILRRTCIRPACGRHPEDGADASVIRNRHQQAGGLFAGCQGVAVDLHRIKIPERLFTRFRAAAFHD